MANELRTQNQALNSVKALLEQSKGAIASRLPKHITPDRITKVALTAINKTPKLLECTRESLLMSIMQAAELGLEPGGALGEGYLIPYKNQCQFIPGYRGLISLARRSGQIVSLEAHVVHEKDAFECSLGLNPTLTHTPAWDAEDPGSLRFVYAVAKLKDGGTQFDVMSRAQVEGIRKRSKAATSGPWVTDYEEMARKTVVRRLFKYLPVSVELAQALDLQAGAETGEFITLEPESAQALPESTHATPIPWTAEEREDFEIMMIQSQKAFRAAGYDKEGTTFEQTWRARRGNTGADEVLAELREAVAKLTGNPEKVPTHRTILEAEVIDEPQG